MNSPAAPLHDRLSPAPRRRAARGVVVALLVVVAGWLLTAPSVRAAGTPDLGLTATAPSQLLLGSDLPVELVASTPGGSVDGYGLAYRVVLPPGVSYVPGSAGTAAGEPSIIVEQPSAGKTTLLWQSAGDLPGGTAHRLRFDVRPLATSYPVNTTFTVVADVYGSDDPHTPPQFTVAGQLAAAVTASAVGATTSPTQVKSVTLTETATDQPGGTLLRGLHDHQSVITLNLRGAPTGTTSEVTLDYYLPAGLEYLGCGGAGADHTTSAATNPGHTEEYPGSGAITVPAVPSCVAPQNVTTTTTDPPGPLPNGVYTQLRWTSMNVAQNANVDMAFAVAIPLRANTMTWTGGMPNSGGAQAANLDNNSGSEIADGTVLGTTAYLTGKYNGLTPIASSVDGTRIARDLRVRKSGSSSSLTPAATTDWQLDVDTSEYRSAANVVVSDTVPDGLCPVQSSSTLIAGPPSPSDSECDPGTDPSDPYAAADEQSDGTWQVSWDATAIPALSELPPNTSRTITYTTRTRSHYQEAFDDDTPVLAGDVVTNAAQAGAELRVTCGGSGPDPCPGGAPTGDEISHDGALTQPLTATASATLTAATGSADKQVALSGSDCSTGTYTDATPSYSPGDRVCWLTRLDFPSGLNAAASQIIDTLPPSLAFDPLYGLGGEEPTANDTVGASTFDASAATPGPGGTLQWTPPTSYTTGGTRFEHRVATRLQLPASGTDQMLVENVFRGSLATTDGTHFAVRDASTVQLRMPVLALAERITAVDGVAVTAAATRTIRGGERLTYRLRVTNTGGKDADALEVWDRLPAGLTCSDVVSIGATGTCAGDIVTFGAAPTIGLSAAANGGTADLTFDLLVPTTIEVGQQLVTASGVRQYQSATNVGGAYTYTPASNIDASLNASANVPAVASATTLTGAIPTITETRTTGLIESNNSDIEATIGERVTYTVSATVPAGLTVRELNVTDAIDVRHSYVANSLQQTAGPAMTLGISSSTITLSLPTSWTAPTGSDTTFTFAFDTLVADTAANTRGGVQLSNRAALHWTPFGTVTGGTQFGTTAPEQLTTIVEPALMLTKVSDSVATPLVGGDVVQYTLTLGTAAAPAHESTLVDHVPVGMTPLNAAGDPISDGESTLDGGEWDATNRTLTFSPNATITAGNSQAFVYNVRVDTPVVSGSQLDNTADATTTSLPGVVAAERTTASPVTTGYTKSSTARVTIKKATATITSSPTSRTPGEKVAYTVEVTLPKNVTVLDTFVRVTVPDSIDVDGHGPLDATTCTAGCTPGQEPAVNWYTPIVNGDGTTTVAWDLGDVAYEPAQRTIMLRIDGHVRTTHLAGGTRVSRPQTPLASVQIMTDRTDKVGVFAANTLPTPAGGFDDTSVVSTATVNIVEPGVVVDGQVSVGGTAYSNGPRPVHDGDTISYRITITNNGNSPLYDVAVTSTPDSGLRNVQLDAGLSTSANTDPFTSADPQMTWLVPGPIAAGSSAELTYSATLPDISTLVDEQVIDHTASVTDAWGVPKATRDADGFLYHQYTAAPDSTQLKYDAPTLTTTKTTGAPGNPDSAAAQVGVSFPWRVSVRNTSATETATALTVHDTLPPDWRYVPGSAQLNTAPVTPLTPTITSNPAGDQLTFTSSVSLAPSATRILTYQARPLLAAATSTGTGAGAPHVNTAYATVLNNAGSPGDGNGLFKSTNDTAQAILDLPSLGVSVTPDSGTGIAGEAVSYTVHIENGGAAPMTGVTLVATMPAQTTYLPGTATAVPSAGFAEATATASSATWTIPTLAVGDAVDITVPVTTSSALAAGSQVVLSVDASANEALGPITDDGAFTLSRTADLDASIGATPNPVAVGGTLSYTVGAQNHGPSNASDVTTTTVLPADLTYASGPGECSYTGATRTVTCTWPGETTPAQTRSATFTATVAPSATGSAMTTTTVSAATTDPDAGNDTDSVNVTLGINADLQLSAAPPSASVAIGNTTTLTVSLHNAGPSDAANSTLAVTLPAGVTLVSAAGICSVVGAAVSCPATMITSGATKTAQITVRGDAVGSHTIIASATSSTADPVPTNNLLGASVTVTPVADLAPAVSAPASIAAGATASVTLSAVNHGPSPATGVTLAVVLPAGTRLAGSGRSIHAAAASCTQLGQLATCAVPGTVAVGDTATASAPIEVPTALAEQQLTWTASVTANEADPAVTTATATTTVGPSADVSVELGGAEQVLPGQQAPLTITVRNAGPSAAQGVVVTNELPEGVQFVRFDAPAGVTCNLSGRTLTCTLGTLPAGASPQITVTLAVPAGAAGVQLISTAQASSATPDPNGANASAATQTAVVAPATPEPPAPRIVETPAATPTAAPQPQTTLQLRVRASTTKLRGGRTITYKLDVRNTGSHAATGVRLCDRLPQWMSFAPKQDGFLSGAQLCFRTKHLEAGKRIVQKVRVRVSRRAKRRAVLVNHGSVEADNALMVSASTKGRVVTDGRLNAATVRGFTG